MSSFVMVLWLQSKTLYLICTLHNRKLKFLKKFLVQFKFILWCFEKSSCTKKFVSLFRRCQKSTFSIFGKLLGKFQIDNFFGSKNFEWNVTVAHNYGHILFVLKTQEWTFPKLQIWKLVLTITNVCHRSNAMVNYRANHDTNESLWIAAPAIAVKWLRWVVYTCVSVAFHKCLFHFFGGYYRELKQFPTV